MSVTYPGVFVLATLTCSGVAQAAPKAARPTVKSLPAAIDVDLGGPNRVDVVSLPRGGVVVLNSESQEKLLEHGGDAARGERFWRFEPEIKRFTAPTGRSERLLGLTFCIDPPPKTMTNKCQTYWLWNSPDGLTLLGHDYTPVRTTPLQRSSP